LKFFSKLAKTAALIRKMLIGTHSGTFHCDEALACYLLKLLPEYKDASILRTRDETKLGECEIVVDVGGIYDPETKRFDHHQRTFVESMSTLDPKKPWTTRLSSAGLVYAHFGKQILSQVFNKPSDHRLVQDLFDSVYENLLEEIDANDNGIPVVVGEPNFYFSTTLGLKVRNIQPAWNSNSDGSELDGLFQDAMKLVGEEFSSSADFLSKSLLSAAEEVPKGLTSRFDVHESGEIVEMDELVTTARTWKYHLKDAEAKHEAEKSVKFVLGTDSVTSAWSLSAIPVELPHGSELRLTFPEEWRGKYGDELVELTGNETAIFVGFRGESALCRTREGAISLAAECLRDLFDLKDL
jgi:uncharacterized UPF0160 family protein